MGAQVLANGACGDATAGAVPMVAAAAMTWWAEPQEGMISRVKGLQKAPAAAVSSAVLPPAPCFGTRAQEEGYFDSFSATCIGQKIEHDPFTMMPSMTSTASSSKVAGRSKNLPPRRRLFAAQPGKTLEVPGCTTASERNFEPQFCADSSEHLRPGGFGLGCDVGNTASVARQSAAEGARLGPCTAAAVGCAKSGSSTPTTARITKSARLDGITTPEAPIGATSRETGGAADEDTSSLGYAEQLLNNHAHPFGAGFQENRKADDFNDEEYRKCDGTTCIKFVQEIEAIYEILGVVDPFQQCSCC